MGILKRKRFPVFFLLGIFLFSTSLHAIPASLPGIVSPADAFSQVGIVAAVRGAVQITSRGQVGKVAGSGQPVYLGDAVSTDEKGSLQILLLDQTVFTVGPSSSIIIDQFVYDPATDDGIVKAKIVKGIFRFVTGKIGQKKPQQMEVELPSGNIGIRGTIVAGEVTGKKSMVVLLGPGEKNNTGHRGGKFILSNESGGRLRQETVGKTGFGSTIEGDGAAPTKPFQLPADQLERLTTALGPLPVTNSQSQGGQSGGQEGNSPSNGEGGESPTEQAGQGTAVAGDSVGFLNFISALVQSLTGEANKSSQDSISDTVKVQDGIAKFSDLSRIQSGLFYYFVSAAPQSGGTHTLKFNIDFGARQVGGGQSNFSMTGTGAGSASLAAIPFGSTGNAEFNYSFSNFCGAGCTATLHVDLLNQNNVAAASSQYAFTSSNGSVTGSGTAARLDGAAP